MLFILFVIYVWALLFLLYKKTFRVRESILITTMTEMLCIIFFVEGLSVIRALDHLSLVWAWFIFSILLSIIFLIVKGEIPALHIPKRVSRISIVTSYLLIFQIGLTGYLAFTLVPSTWDSMTYHLGRIVHWEQEKSVMHYATHIDRQVQMPPAAEFLMLNSYLLTENDQFVNYTQWTAMIISLIGVSLITQHLGGDKYQQLAAAAICAALPMGIYQSTSTQNDYVVAMCIVCLVSFLINLHQEPKKIVWWIGAGIALGLALLTKGTAYIFVSIIILITGISLLKKVGVIYSIKIFSVIGLLALLINAGHYTRNYNLYRSPLGPSTGYQNEVFTLGSLSANIIRNSMIHVIDKTTIVPIDQVGHSITSLLFSIYKLTEFGTTDSRITLSGPSDDVFESPLGLRANEDLAGNPLHLILIVISIPMAFFLIGKYVKTYILGLVLMFLLFSAYLKWQIWGSRLQLPMFVLWAPVISIALFRWRLLNLIPIIAMAMSFLWISAEPTRLTTLLTGFESRSSGYFGSMGQDNFLDYKSVANSIMKSECKSVGLVISEDTREYPLWMMLRENGFNGRIEHVKVSNQTKKFQELDFEPCATYTFDRITYIQNEP